MKCTHLDSVELQRIRKNCVKDFIKIRNNCAFVVL